MELEALRMMHNSVKPHSKWVAAEWNCHWGVWTDEGPVGGKHICDCDEEEAKVIAGMRNHFAEMLNFIKVSENYKIEAMEYAKSAIHMCKDIIPRGVYEKAYDRMADAEQHFENAMKRIEEI